MKKIKIILLMLVVILFSGCTVNYDLYINNDLSVNEKIIASDSAKNIKMKTRQEPKVAADSLFKIYKNENVNYSFSTIEDEYTITSTAIAAYDTLDEYKNKFKSNIVKEVIMTKKDNIITLEFNQDEPISSNSSKSLVYDEIKVNINVPFTVTDNNADEINGNTYTWNIKKDQKLKKIKISFNTKETKTSKIFNFGFLQVNVKYYVLVILGFAILIGLIILIVYLNNKKNNRI